MTSPQQPPLPRHLEDAAIEVVRLLDAIPDVIDKCRVLGAAFAVVTYDPHGTEPDA